MVGVGPSFMASRSMVSRKKLFWSIPCLLNYIGASILLYLNCLNRPVLFSS